MITNGSLTIFHKGFDVDTRLEKWIRFNYSNVWFVDKQGAIIDKGYSERNNFECRIPYAQNENLNVKNFAKADIAIKGTINYDISDDSELDDFETYNIKVITNANYGTSDRQHIHLSGE